ncbi:OmpA family protein [Candidatus Kapabacteria bacterium]|nr:OmpA family protein [Candidatus Kapabacteria bacterium]
MKNILLILMIPILLSAQSAFNKQSYFLGAGIDFGQNTHRASFSSLQNAPSCCPEFTDGSGLALKPNIYAGLPLSNSFYLTGTLGYQTQDGKLESSESTFVYLPTGDFADGEFNHILDTKLSTVYFEPRLDYTLPYNINIGFGYRFGLLIGKSFSQSELLTKPTNTGAFYNEETGEIIGRKRNEISGDIDQTVNIQHGVSIQVSYDLPLNSTNDLFISPYINYYYGISEFVTGSDWSNSSISAGLSIKFAKAKSFRIDKQIYKIDTLQITKDFIAKSYLKLGLENSEQYTETSSDTIFSINEISRTDTLFIQGKKPEIDFAKEASPTVYISSFGETELIGLDSIGNPIPFDHINLEVELTREVYPLLPYVFFDENSEIIPTRYKKINNSFDFDESKIPPSPINYHRNNLNIIGKRLAENPNSNISIYGYIDPTTEDNCTLAKWRALAIQKYINETFKIDKSRMSIIADESNCYPSDRTRTKSQQGYAENRRVVITTNTPELLFAVSRAKYQEPKLVEPSTIIIDLKANNLESFKEIPKTFNPYLTENSDIKTLAPANWELNVYQGSNILLQESQNTSSAKFPIEITRFNASELNNLKPLEVKLEVFDKKNMSVNYSKKVSIIKDTAEIEVEKLTLTIFEVSQSKLNSRIKKEIKEFVNQLDSKSEINITGYSDNLGSAKANKSLSAVRANEVKTYIKSLAPKAKFGSVKGVGSDEFPPGVNSYKSPEERFMSRTVEIEIRTIR